VKEQDGPLLRPRHRRDTPGLVELLAVIRAMNA